MSQLHTASHSVMQLSLQKPLGALDLSMSSGSRSSTLQGNLKGPSTPPSPHIIIQSQKQRARETNDWARSLHLGSVLERKIVNQSSDGFSRYEIVEQCKVQTFSHRLLGEGGQGFQEVFLLTDMVSLLLMTGELLRREETLCPFFSRRHIPISVLYRSASDAGWNITTN